MPWRPGVRRREPPRVRLPPPPPAPYERAREGHGPRINRDKATKGSESFTPIGRLERCATIGAPSAAVCTATIACSATRRRTKQFWPWSLGWALEIRDVFDFFRFFVCWACFATKRQVYITNIYKYYIEIIQVLTVIKPQPSQEQLWKQMQRTRGQGKDGRSIYHPGVDRRPLIHFHRRSAEGKGEKMRREIESFRAKTHG